MIAASAALWFLPFATAIGIWVAWSDMKVMKIPNMAVLALLLVYLVVGPAALPLDVWLWGWAVGAMVLLAGFVANLAGLVGAGDAKFAAAMGPLMAEADLRLVLALFPACLLGAFVAHRGMGRIGAFRAATGDWESWTRRDFPMGLALAGTLIFYLLGAVLLR